MNDANPGKLNDKDKMLLVVGTKAMAVLLIICILVQETVDVTHEQNGDTVKVNGSREIVGRLYTS